MLLWLGFAPTLCAVELLEQLSAIQIPKELPITPDVLEKKKYNLLAMIIGCELNDQCVLSMLKAVIKSDPNPVYNAFLLKLEAQSNRIEYEAVYCNTKENQLVKKSIAACLSSELKKNTPQAETSIDSIEEGVNNCIQQSMEKLANEGDIFAQAALVRYLMKMGRVEEGKSWAQVIQQRAGTPAFEAYQRCVQPIH